MKVNERKHDLHERWKETFLGDVTSKVANLSNIHYNVQLFGIIIAACQIPIKPLLAKLSISCQFSNHKND